MADNTPNTSSLMPLDKLLVSMVGEHSPSMANLVESALELAYERGELDGYVAGHRDGEVAVRRAVRHVEWYT